MPKFDEEDYMMHLAEDDVRSAEIDDFEKYNEIIDQENAIYENYAAEVDLEKFQDNFDSFDIDPFKDGKNSHDSVGFVDYRKLLDADDEESNQQDVDYRKFQDQPDSQDSVGFVDYRNVLGADDKESDRKDGEEYDPYAFEDYDGFEDYSEI